MFINYH